MSPLRHPCLLPLEKLLEECEIRRQRRSGPGGQHRNKVETAIYLRHAPTGVESGASERRSQEQNRQVALHRLRVALAIEIRSPSTGCEGPSDLWRARCHHRSITVSTRHVDYPPLLAEALDALDERGFQVAKAAEWLECSSSSLMRFLKRQPEAWQRVNQRRQELGLKPLQ